MKKTGVKALIKGVRMAASKNSPAILTGIGIALGLTATVLAVKATPKALQMIEEKEDKVNDQLTPVEVVKAAWKPYIPAVATTLASATCLIGAHSVHMKRTAALAAACKLSETALTEYSSKVIESVGERKERTIREKVAQERVEKDSVGKSELVVIGQGETHCYDYISKREFPSDIEKLKRAENNLNKQMLHDICGYASLNDFYTEIGLDHVEYGDDIGWNTENLIDLDLYATLLENGRPCIVVAHHNAPSYKFC